MSCHISGGSIFMKRSALHLFVLYTVFIGCTSFATSTVKKYLYHVWYKGVNIGKVYLTHQQTGENHFISMQAAVSVKKILTFNIISRDEALFKAGVLHWSKVYREMNGKTLDDKKTTRENAVYRLEDEGTKTTLHGLINQNILGMYLNEPKNSDKIYADNHQKFVVLNKTGEHRYQTILPDGSVNTYTYANNRCVEVDVKSTYYNIRIVVED